MNDFEQVISNLAKESGLPLEIDNKNSVTLEYDDIFITLQWRADFNDIFIFAPITDPEKISYLSEPVLRSALKLSFGGFGTSGNFLGIVDESLVLSTAIGLKDLNAEQLAEYIFSFANAAESVRVRIVNELQDVPETEENTSSVSPLGLSV